MDTQNTTPALEPKPKTVEVNEDALQQLIKTVEDQQKRISMLTEVADKGRMDLWQRRHQAPMLKKVHLTTYNGKTVVGWRMTANEVYQNPLTGAWHEKQEVEVLYEDNGKEVLPYKIFMTQSEKLPATVLSTVRDSEGNETLTVEVETQPGQPPKKLVIGSRFIN